MNVGLPLIELDEHECFRRLGSTQFGRIALSSGALPVIFPIHFALLDRDPVFRTDPGTKALAAGAGQVICLEVDDIDPETHTGWSVLVTGRAELLREPDEVAAANRLPLRPWTGRGDAFVRITASLVSGRQIESPPEHGGGLAPSH